MKLGVYAYDWAGGIWSPPSSINSPIYGQGILRLGPGDPLDKIRSLTDPQVISHEFCHSIQYDQFFHGNPGPLPNYFKAFNEGLADAFAMTFSYTMVQKEPPGFWLPGEDYPFILGGQTYIDFADQLEGLRNLTNPLKSASETADYYTVWNPARFLPGQDHNPVTLGTPAKPFDYHSNSLVYSVMLKNLITGERKNASYPDWTVTPTGGKYAFGSNAPAGEERETGFKRVEDLVFEILHNQSITLSTSDFIAQIKATADQLEISKGWGFNNKTASERIDMALNVIGVTSGAEQEPNDHAIINVPDVFPGGQAQNLISVGKATPRHQEVKGSVDGGSGLNKDKEDAYILNEKIVEGDTIHFNISKPDGMPLQNPLKVKFYVDEVPDPFEQPVPVASGSACDGKFYPEAREYQVYPEVGYCGQEIYNGSEEIPPSPAQSGSFVLDKIGPCKKADKPPGDDCYSNSNSNWHKMFVVVLGCGCDKQDYKLEVWVERKNKFYWDEL